MSINTQTPFHMRGFIFCECGDRAEEDPTLVGDHPSQRRVRCLNRSCVEYNTSYLVQLPALPRPVRSGP